MNEESKCDCQRCGQPIAFPIDLHNTEVECPHCNRATTLLIPSPSSRVRKADSPSAKVVAGKTVEVPQNVLTICFIVSILVPVIGFFCGIWLLTKNQIGYGVACITTSILVSIGILVLLNSVP